MAFLILILLFILQGSRNRLSITDTCVRKQNTKQAHIKRPGGRLYKLTTADSMFRQRSTNVATVATHSCQTKEQLKTGTTDIRTAINLSATLNWVQLITE
jgi:hypothetical protein